MQKRGYISKEKNFKGYQKKGKVIYMRNFKKILKALGTVVLAGALTVTGIQLPGASFMNGKTGVKVAEAASTTSRLPLWCYMRNSSGVLYTYNYSNLTGRTGYIEPGDYCKILDVYSNGAVRVEYPTSRGKRQAYASSDGFFINVDFNNVTAQIGKGMSVYRRSSGNATIGSTDPTDQVTILGHENGRTQIFYNLTNGSGFKCGWINGLYEISDGSNNNSETSSGQNDNGTKNVSLNVPSFKQYDYPYTYIGTKTIKQIGCLVTSAAMAYSYKTGSTVRPDAMKNKLRFANNDLCWNSLSALGFSMTSFYNRKINNFIACIIYGKLQEGVPVIIGGKNSSGGQHWVVVKGYYKVSDVALDASNFQINDPNSTTRTTLQQFLSKYPTVLRLIY